MPSTILHPLAAVLVAAVITFFTRLAPFALFGRQGTPPKAVRHLGQVLPPAIIALLVVYCLKGGISPLNWAVLAPQLIAVAVVVALHIYKRNNLLSIAGGTAVYMLLIRFVF